jgi:hypothetical protein
VDQDPAPSFPIHRCVDTYHQFQARFRQFAHRRPTFECAPRSPIAWNLRICWRSRSTVGTEKRQPLPLVPHNGANDQKGAVPQQFKALAVSSSAGSPQRSSGCIFIQYATPIPRPENSVMNSATAPLHITRQQRHLQPDGCGGPSGIKNARWLRSANVCVAAGVPSEAPG